MKEAVGLMSIKKQLLQYKEFYENGRIMSQKDLDEYIQDAKNRKLSWAR